MAKIIPFPKKPETPVQKIIRLMREELFKVRENPHEIDRKRAVSLLAS